MNLPNGHYLQGKKYRLTHTIGQGGFGITYLGVWNTEVKGGLGAMKTVVPVCIKEYFFKDYCYRDKSLFDVKVHSMTGEKLFAKFKEKLIEEANILSTVHHPYIVNVLEVFEENNTAYIVMEYIKGNTLKYMLDNEGVFPEHQVIKYTHQIGSALTYVHDKNIVHLDIKPGNILIDQNDNARLIDFGVSKRYDIIEHETSTTTLTLSKGFAAIEQYDNDGMANFSPAPDIYSLGATMYNLLTGIVPIESILRATKPLPPPSAYISTISRKTEKAIMKAMEIKPEDRFRKVNQLLAVIEAPDYDFTENPINETHPILEEDNTDVILGRTSKLPDDEDDRTELKQSGVAKSAKKNIPIHKTRRRLVLTASILLCAFLGYAVFNYFFEATATQGTLTSNGMPSDSLIFNYYALINPVDSIEIDTPDGQEDTSEASAPTQTQTNNKQTNNTQFKNAQTVSTAVNNSTANANSGNETASRTVEPESQTSTLTAAEIAALKNDYSKLIADGGLKFSTGGYESAREDYKKALDIAPKIGMDESDAKNLIEQCEKEINKQEKDVIPTIYDTKLVWGDITIARIKDTQKWGALDATGKEKISFTFRDQRPFSIDLRAFISDDNKTVLYNKQGEYINTINP